MIDKKKKTAAITHVSNVGAKVKIPKKIKKYTVVQIGRMKGAAGSIFSEEGREQLKEIKLPDPLRKIGVKSLKGCVNLKKINFPQQLRYIGGHAMERCYKIKKVILPKELKGIGNFTFFRCKAIEKVVFKTNKARIGIKAGLWTVLFGVI